MKLKIALVTLVIALSLPSCSVTYRTGHPHHPKHKKKVVIVSMNSEQINTDMAGSSTVTLITQ